MVAVADDLDPDAGGVEGEERVVVLAGVGVVLFRARLDPGAGGEAALVRLVDLLAGVDLEGEMLEADLVVRVGAAVGGPDPDPGVPELVVDHLLGAAVALEPRVHLEAEGPEHRVVEGERAVDVGDRQVHVLDPDPGHPGNLTGTGGAGARHPIQQLSEPVGILGHLEVAAGKLDRVDAEKLAGHETLE